jgi:uncharacterized DUF497 family protein
MALTFEWDRDKAEGNRRKHGVDFQEATTVFRDTLSSTICDPDHSTRAEERELTIGLSHRRRLLVVAHCKRGSRIRIINARPATRRERREYEEG